MIEKIWEILTTLTEQAQSSALAKCNELGFPPNRGVVSLEESFINLNAARLILMDAIEKRKLLQLPLTVQKTLLAQLEAIAKSLTGLTGGADEVVNLADRIEQLNAAIWQFGLHNLSEEVLGFQTKLNQLKSQELEAGKVKQELERGLERKKELEQFLEEAKKASDTLQSTVASSDEQSKKLTETLTHTAEMEQKAGALLATVQQNETTSTQLLANTKSSNAEVAAVEARIKEFFGQIDEYRNKITTTSESAEQAVQQNKAETDALISTLKELENQIKDQIVRATGHSLFHSFQTRQEAIARSKRFWGWALAAVVCISVGWSFFLYFETTNLDTIFYLKLSMAIPLIYAITFCNLQYSRERRLEEEYAFKANISISLVPYKDLVENLVNKSNPAEIEKFASFIIESVNKVFTSPTSKVFESEEKEPHLSNRALKQLKPLFEAVTSIAKTIRP